MYNSSLSRTGKLETSAHRNGERSVFFDASVRKNELGVDEFSRTETYIGEWQSDKKDGFGSEIIEGPIRTKYEGQFKAGKRDGRGSLWREIDSTSNPKNKEFKLVYCGEWKNNQPQGVGTFYIAHKNKNSNQSNKTSIQSRIQARQQEAEDIYEGEMNGYQMHGQGVLRYHNGEVYEGNFDSDKPTGNGSMTYVNGNCYVGEWSGGARNGQGRLEYSNGSVYAGIWADNLPIEGEYVTDAREIALPMLEIV